MLVHTERTPNPRAMKFFPGMVLTDFPEGYGPEHAGVHPFLQETFSLGGIEGVFIGRDFVTVTVAGSWDEDDGSLRNAISECLKKHAGTLAGTWGGQAKEPPADSQASHIAEVIEERVRPAVAYDGGDIVFRGYEDGIVFVGMKGACSGCPSAAATLRQGVTRMMRELFPEVREVRSAGIR